MLNNLIPYKHNSVNYKKINSKILWHLIYLINYSHIVYHSLKNTKILLPLLVFVIPFISATPLNLLTKCIYTSPHSFDTTDFQPKPFPMLFNFCFKYTLVPSFLHLIHC